MKKIIYIFICVICFSNAMYAQKIMGKIDHNDLNYKNKIVDSKTNKPLSNVKITIPEFDYVTYSDENGSFKLNIDVVDKAVMFLEKDGYKVFSLTVDNNVFKSPLKLGIEEVSPFDMQISQGVIHLGDNMYSDNSANSSEFRLSANGHYLSKVFERPQFNNTQEVIIKIGTIIGLDTKKAKQNGQNRIVKVYSAPSEVFVNGNKIAILELNGDNVEILIPKSILKETNELIIISGKNLFQTAYTDYDDIEIANLRIEVRQKQYYAGNWFVFI